ncbi:hypothetical protein BRADI_3g00513v3 [Brachypodium distachyon]|uniref:Uncharacterized protein n=1 Tax=Brachypodium distachyon TaxID=15368 RepID=A0A2K2CUG5_BRADI|nr:hypothetical protein BRADI_3g00513v3 [Brachypodium distachyon]
MREEPSLEEGSDKVLSSDGMGDGDGGDNGGKSSWDSRDGDDGSGGSSGCFDGGKGDGGVDSNDGGDGEDHSEGHSAIAGWAASLPVPDDLKVPPGFSPCAPAAALAAPLAPTPSVVATERELGDILSTVETTGLLLERLVATLTEHAERLRELGRSVKALQKATTEEDLGPKEILQVFGFVALCEAYLCIAPSTSPPSPNLPCPTLPSHVDQPAAAHRQATFFLAVAPSSSPRYYRRGCSQILEPVASFTRAYLLLLACCQLPARPSVLLLPKSPGSRSGGREIRKRPGQHLPSRDRLMQC